MGCRSQGLGGPDGGGGPVSYVKFKKCLCHMSFANKSLCSVSILRNVYVMCHYNSQPSVVLLIANYIPVIVTMA